MKVLTCAVAVLCLVTLGFLGCGGSSSGPLPTAPTSTAGGGGTVTQPTTDVEGVTAAGPVSGATADTGDMPVDVAKPADDKKVEVEKPASDKPADEKKSDDENPAVEKKSDEKPTSEKKSE